MSQDGDRPVLMFKGFEGEWEEQKAINLAEYSKGYGYSKSDLSETGTPIILYGSLYTNYQLSIKNVETFVLAQPNSVFSQGNEVIVPASGETAEDIARASAVMNPGVIIGGDLNIIRPNESVVPSFLALSISNGSLKQELAKMAQGKSVVHIHNADIQKLTVTFPSHSEQKLIVEYFSQLDQLISLQEQKHEKLQSFKKAMLDKMFPQKGNKVPEIRFRGFAGIWETKPLSELVQIERGGSPRPIQDYITQSADGLNWVKIGDAPKQGHYITKTAEKIRPEGLAKTREVHVGDLILSNSMSFGRPYIMGVDGCIHDGWLLIRNTYKAFDLIFLCYLLASPQMLQQYKALAAGSTVNNLNKDLVSSAVVMFPKIDEQRAIGQYLSQLDQLISLSQQKLNKLQAIKKAMLERMFPSARG